MTDVLGPDVPGRLRAGCARVAARSRYVAIEQAAIPAYAAALALDTLPAGSDPDTHLLAGTREELAAFWLTLDAINFGSGWFPALRKPAGRSGYHTIATGVRERFIQRGPWTAEELARMIASEIAQTLGQSADHELMSLFAWSLSDLGEHVLRDHRGQFSALVDSADGSAITLAERLGGWNSFGDTSTYDGLEIPFLKRAQIAAADLARAGVAGFADLDRLTMFADNLVPHVLRLDGVLRFEPELTARIDRGELIEHGSPEEVEIRACALHSVELIVAARPGSCAVQVDQLLGLRGGEPRYKASPRHRSRCTAY